jgi:hypothetical protein
MSVFYQERDRYGLSKILKEGLFSSTPPLITHGGVEDLMARERTGRFAPGRVFRG